MTAREYIYRMLDTYHVPSSDFRMVHAGEKAVETVMIEFAQEKVKEALEAALKAVDDNVISNCEDHTPFWGECQSCGRYDNPAILRDEDTVKLAIKESYPLENVK
jgi:hypothetical protein